MCRPVCVSVGGGGPVLSYVKSASLQIADRTPTALTVAWGVGIKSKTEVPHVFYGFPKTAVGNEYLLLQKVWRACA